jgi:DNA-binding NarL/FixJ family response regulator
VHAQQRKSVELKEGGNGPICRRDTERGQYRGYGSFRGGMRTLVSSQVLPRLKVLLLEDDPRDAELILAAVGDAAPGSSVQLADNRTDFVRTLEEFVPDVILCDHAVADFNALDAFRLAQSRAPGSPFILVSGEFQQKASECLQAGAADFIPKSELGRLGPAIASALSLRVPLRRLTHRQRQVLQLFVTGCSTREIARGLHISAKTVETHRAQLQRRLDIHDLAGLVRYAVRVGMVSAIAINDPEPGDRGR